MVTGARGTSVSQSRDLLSLWLWGGEDKTDSRLIQDLSSTSLCLLSVIDVEEEGQTAH